MKIRPAVAAAIAVLVLAVPASAFAANFIFAQRTFVPSDGQAYGAYGHRSWIAIYHDGVNRTVKATFDYQNPAYGNPSYQGLVNPFSPSNPNPNYNTDPICYNVSLVNQYMTCWTTD